MQAFKMKTFSTTQTMRSYVQSRVTILQNTSIDKQTWKITDFRKFFPLKNLFSFSDHLSSNRISIKPLPYKTNFRIHRTPSTQSVILTKIAYLLCWESNQYSRMFYRYAHGTTYENRKMYTDVVKCTGSIIRFQMPLLNLICWNIVWNYLWE